MLLASSCVEALQVFWSEVAVAHSHAGAAELSRGGFRGGTSAFSCLTSWADSGVPSSQNVVAGLPALLVFLVCVPVVPESLFSFVCISKQIHLVCGCAERLGCVKPNGSRTGLIPNAVIYNNPISMLLLKNSSGIFSWGSSGASCECTTRLW